MKINASMLSNSIIPFDENGNPLKDTPINISPDTTNPNSMNDIVPLLHCQLADLKSTPTIDINISKIIDNKQTYTPEQINQCKNALGNYSICSNASMNDKDAPFCNINWGPNTTGTNCGHQWDGTKIVENNNYCLTKSDNNSLICASGLTEQQCMSDPDNGNIWCEPCHMGVPFDDNVVTKKICVNPSPGGCTNTPNACGSDKNCPQSGCCDDL